MYIRDQDILRCVKSIVADELKRSRPDQMVPGSAGLWTAETSFDRHGLSFDSLELIGAATAVTQLFNLDEIGIEDYLLVERSFGAWTKLVSVALQQGCDTLTFRSSGSTAEPVGHRHPLAWLAQEVAALDQVLSGARRIVSLVPAQHIYGCLFTVLLPSHSGLPVLDALALSPVALHRRLLPGDVMVAPPAMWEMIARATDRLPPGVVGVTSTAPMPPALARRLAALGLSRLVEVYGSSETAGIGWRDDPEHPFTLFDHWTPVAAAAAAAPPPVLEAEGEAEQAPSLLWRADPAGGAPLGPFSIPDHVAWEGPRALRPVGRRDHAVQVAGHNVWPQRVARALEALPEVAQAAVRLDAETGRLKAFIVPRAGVAAGSDLRAHLSRWADTALEPPARPRAFTFGGSLPRTSLGKLADWPIAAADPVSVPVSMSAA